MKTIITLTGHKEVKKDYIANKLAENSDVGFVRPYTDIDTPFLEEDGKQWEYNVVLPSVLDDMVSEEEVLCYGEINGQRYVFFQFQLVHDYNVLIVDDYYLYDLKNKWDGAIYSVKLVQKDQVESERVGVIYKDEDFDMVFDVDRDDIFELEARLEARWE